MGREWCVGSIAGEAGESLKVCITGEKAGIWKDFAGSDAGDLLDLWAATRGISMADAMREARDYLGVVTPAFAGPAKREYRKPERPKATKPIGKVLDYLKGRGLHPDTLAAYKVAGNDADDGIIFPFLRGGDLVNIKYLALERPDGKKKVSQEKDAEPSLFGWQAIPDRARAVVICEGEIDAMTWFQMGFPALSVWSGAGNLQWIENEWERLARFDRIYVAFDTDEAGMAGAAATIERLGRARCMLVRTPYKDANECLLNGCDRESFRDIIDAAESMDPQELRSASEFKDAVMLRFFPAEGSTRGWQTPFDKLTKEDVYFHPGELIIVNGINGHGKTKMIAQISLALMRQQAKCCMASMEVKPDMLLHSMTAQACATRSPTAEFVGHVQDWWDGRLWIFDVVSATKADYLLDVFRYARQRYGITCFFIDSLAKCGLAEDDYNGQKRFVEKLCDFKNETDSTVFLVTHSRKLEAESRIVDKMDIKGTGAIADLADIVTTVWRNKAKHMKPEQEQSRDDPDARWYWQKNRNGDFEGSCQLWFASSAYQFLEHSGAHPKPLIHFMRDVSADHAVPF